MLIYAVIILLCCFMYGASAVFCKLALQRSLPLTPNITRLQKIASIVTNKTWLAGVALSVSANLIIIQIQSVADLSIVYPILNFAYVFTLILGYCFLHEMLTRAQWIGVVTAVVGTAILLFVENPTTGHQTEMPHLGIISLVSVVIMATLAIFARKDQRQIPEVYYAICAGVAFGNVETFLKVNTNLVTADLGYFSILSLESVLRFLSIWPFFVLLALGIIGFIFMQMAYSHGEISVSVPLIVVTQRPVTLFSGYFAFGEEFPAIKIFGIVTILLSMVILTLSTMRKGSSTKILPVTS